MAAQVFFQAWAWTDDSKTNLLTIKPITRFSRVFRHMELNQPYEYELTALLTDKVAANIGRGSYVELYVGKVAAGGTYPPAGQTLWMAGYVEQLTKNVARTNEYQIVLHSASLHLSHRRDMGALEMDYPTYKSFLDALNGVGTKPGKYGILSGSGWKVAWNHKQGTSIPGSGDSWRTDWASMLTNVNTMMQIYGLQWRERIGSTATNGTIDTGDLGDDSGVTYYGGDPLAQQIGFASHTRPNAAVAQQQGLNIIATAAYTEDTSQIVNICWPLGAGSNDTLVSISGSTGFNGPPLDKNGNTQYGWNAWTPVPGGTTWYVQNSNKQTYNNMVYALIAEKRQDNDWAYGVVDVTSVNGDQYTNAQGIREMVLTEKKTKDPNVLLSQACGVLVTNSRPISTWQFVTKPARNASGVPSFPLPGQTVTVNYAGAVHQSIDLDLNAASATYGQYIGAGDYTYLSFPNTNDPNLIAKAKKVIVMEDEWSGKQYVQTLTMGKMQKNVHHVLNELADDFEQHRHTMGKKYTFTHHRLDDIPFIFSQNPDAWEDPTQSQITFAPGGIAVSNVPNEQFFDDHHAVEFTVTINDPNQVMAFWMAKPTDGSLTNPVGSRGYPIFRLMFGGGTPSPTEKRGSGFFWTDTTGTGFPAGDIVNKRMFDSKGRLRHTGTYRVRIVWSGGKYEAHVARVENGSSVWQHDLASIWHDTTAKVSTQGAIGWHIKNGTSNASVGSIHMHPHTKKSNSHSGGHGTGSSQVHKSGGSGHRHVSYDEAAQTLVTMHRTHTTGNTHGVGGVVHGPFHPTSALVSSVAGGTPTTVGFSAPLPKGSLKPGWIVYDNSGTFCFVKDVILNGANKVTGFSTLDTNAANFTLNEMVLWDPLENESDPLHGQGHKRFGIYNPPTSPDDPKGGWAIVDRAADAPNDGSKDFLIYPDGSTSIGDKPLTQQNGAVVNITELIIGGEHIAKGLEKEGAVLFDAGEYDSTTQQAIPYQSNGAAGATITPSTASFYGGNPTQIQASWVDTTQDAYVTKGDADAILQLTAGTYSSVTYTTARWFDTQILTEEKDKNGNQIQRRYTVKKDVTFSIPVYFGVQQTPTAAKLGSVFTFTSFDAATKLMHAALDDGTRASIVNGDTFVLNPGGTTQETFTVVSVDTANKTLTLSANLTYTHVKGELIVQKTAGGHLVQSYGLLDGTTSLNQVAAAVDVVAVGFYGYTKDAAGNKTYAWYRGHWGDPEFATRCPYAAAGTMKYLGALPSGNTPDFLDLNFKAHQLGLHWGQSGSQPPVTIEGVELAIYSASPGAGVTVYFDAHSQGHAAHKTKQPAGSVTSGQVAPGAVKAKHTHTVQTPTAHHHSDFTFWFDKNNVVHWETGSIVMHDATVFTINGGTEDNPNSGIAGHAGDYLVFNTSTSAVTLKDPSYGTVTVPAYSASGGSGGQSTGFAVLSEGYKFNARVGGGSAKNGLPDAIAKIGKIGKTPDTYTGELPVHTHHSSGKGHAKHQRAGSSARKHQVKHHSTARHQFRNVIFSIAGTS